MKAIFYDKLYKAIEKEQQAQDLICNKFNVVIVDVPCNNKYDFLTSDGVKYEVKNDKRATLTGNYFIEYIQNDKPSGIKTTDANYYILITDNKILLISVDSIKMLLKLNSFKIKSVNDTVPTSGYIVPCTELLSLGFLL